MNTDKEEEDGDDDDNNDGDVANDLHVQDIEHKKDGKAVTQEMIKEWKSGLEVC